MYESYYGFTEKPFSLLSDPELLYMGKSHTAALAMLEYGLLNRAGFTVVTGEIGSGKTTLIRKMLRNIGGKQTVGLVTNTHKEMGDLLPWVLHAFGQDYLEANRITQYDKLARFLEKQKAEGCQVILIIDEAQNLPEHVLEELRTVSNLNADKHQLMQIMLVGQPELREMLRNPNLKQFTQRVSVDYHIPAFEVQETQEYIRHRLIAVGGKSSLFTDDACSLIHYVSGGVPRVINVICDTVLSFGFADQKQKLDETYVKGVLKERSEGGILALARDPDGYFKKNNLMPIDVDELLEKGWRDGKISLPDCE